MILIVSPSTTLAKPDILFKFSQQNDLSKTNPDKLNDMITRYEEILGKEKKEAEKLELE